MKLRHGVASVHALLLLAAGGLHAAPAVEIRLHPAADVDAGQVLLGSAATIHAVDLPTMSALVALPLGRAPAPGRETVLRRDAIARWVRTRTGLAATDVAWTGADEIVVRGRGDPRAPGDASPAARATVVRRGDWATLRARAGAIEIEDRVEILQDAAAGELVQVRGSVSSASFAARVVGRGLLEAAP